MSTVKFVCLLLAGTALVGGCSCKTETTPPANTTTQPGGLTLHMGA